MLTLPLEPTDDRAAPTFKDAASCTQWLGQLQLTNLQQAHAKISTQLDEFNRYPLRGLERLHVLELLREAVGHIQHDYAKKLAAKALPLNDSELAMFEAISGMWQGMVTGYQRCLQAYLAGDQQLAAYGALLCHRCFHYSGLQILEYLRTGYEVDGQLWRQLHALYSFAEEQELLLAEVEDELSTHARHSSCRAVYLKLLLVCHAQPSELTRGQLQILDRWLSLWSETLSIEHSYTVSRGDAPPLAVDLDSEQGLQPLKQVEASQNNLRFLPMVPLSKLLRVKIILLQQGQSPQQLELGPSGSAVECAEFLSHLHRNWCENRPERRATRRQVATDLLACYDIEGIYARIADKPFRKPRKNVGMDTSARNQIATFGRVLSDTARHNLDELGFIQEEWQAEDVSIIGARLLRQPTDGIRLHSKQLIATHAPDSTCCTLGAISWLTVTRDGQLRAGVRFLPGKPQAVAVDTTGIGSISGSSAAALLLPAMPELKIPASLIIPRGLFQAGHMLEVTTADGAKLKIKMGISIEQGFDYERISFSES